MSDTISRKDKIKSYIKDSNFDESYKTVYGWVKGNVISLSEFKSLIRLIDLSKDLIRLQKDLIRLQKDLI